MFCINDHAASHRMNTLNLLVTVISDEITLIVKTFFRPVYFCLKCNIMYFVFICDWFKKVNVCKKKNNYSYTVCRKMYLHKLKQDENVPL